MKRHNALLTVLLLLFLAGCTPSAPESYLTVDRTGQWNDAPDGQMFFVCEWDRSP